MEAGEPIDSVLGPRDGWGRAHRSASEAGGGRGIEPAPLTRLRQILDVQRRRQAGPGSRGRTPSTRIDRRIDRASARLPTLRLSRAIQAEGPGGNVTTRREAQDPGTNQCERVLRINVLGPVEVKGCRRRLTGQQQSLITALACLGPQTRTSLIDLLWGGKAISASRFANLLSEVRSAVGRHRLIQDDQGRYQILETTTDLAMFADLVGGADVGPLSSQKQSERLSEAIGLIRGRVFESDSGRSWRWLDNSYQLVSKAEELVVDGALRLIALAGAEHDWELATWACDQALTAVPHDDRLVAELAAIYLAKGRTVAAAELITRWEEARHRLGLGEPPTDLRRLLAR